VQAGAKSELKGKARRSVSAATRHFVRWRRRMCGPPTRLRYATRRRHGREAGMPPALAVAIIRFRLRTPRRRT